MWDWINCHIAHRHEFVVWTGSNEVFLRCLRCGCRSSGWRVTSPSGEAHVHSTPAGDASRRHGIIAATLAMLGLSLVQR
jgi:hypothetical protein